MHIFINRKFDSSFLNSSFSYFTLEWNNNITVENNTFSQPLYILTDNYKFWDEVENYTRFSIF